MSEPKSTKPATKHQNYTESLTGPQGKVTFDMVAVPGGDFQPLPTGEKLLDDCFFAGPGHDICPLLATRSSSAVYQPYRRSPCSSTSTIFSPVRNESGVDRPVMNG